jgi:serine/threonine protein kinase
VKLSLDSKPVLTAVKTSLNPNCVELIQREASILKALKHSLILKLRRDIVDIPDHRSGIMIEFAGKGSLAVHLPPSDRRLKGGNRITKVIVGIGIVMQYLHSQDVIHNDLKLDNMLSDWDWRAHIADFGHSILRYKRDIH